MILGFLLVLVAAFFQGTFLAPMSLTRKWAWEHTWAAFTLFGMWLLNWMLAVVFLPSPFRIYALVPGSDLLALVLFGAGWGVGAVLFGLGMDKLGLTLGYPLIMGLTAASGALLPMIWLGGGHLLSARSLTVFCGTALAIAGIVVCSIAGARKESSAAQTARRPEFASGLAIGIAAGCLCCLPNIGMAFGASAIQAAKTQGASEAQAGNAVWAIFFTLGGLVNLGYCALRMARRRNFGMLSMPGSLRNLGLGAGMALMWIGSFYFYGMGASRLGSWGAVIGWPVLISVSIGIGILWGLWRGEWKAAPSSAGRLLSGGLLLILVAVVTLASANAIHVK